MTRIALASAALLAFAGVASAASSNLSSASEVTISTLAPDVQVDTLTPIQVREINNSVSSDEGLTQPQLRTILAQ
ncbi:hypothetical protein [Falsirhodobacter sp. 20TX0035]|uniref:hypothetical protein n=1 Tax=Falsirhodobacter sp. 20TX0035 TaxID=3022019 RepID=UPI00232C765C|nr:hypothetical protein [Falsirhodobacter sp. 20TX0035]MDB6454613.1 hypothetical protein [Falsirhodobacter sp. 20TX0035]